MTQKADEVEIRDEGMGHAKPRDVWLEGSESVLQIGLRHTLEKDWRVSAGVEPPGDSPLACAIYCVEDMEGLSEGLGRFLKLFSETPVLVFGLRLDLPLASAALQAGARGFVHAGMGADQIRRAVKVAVGGEVVAPRQLLGYLIASQESADLDLLSARQREILKLVADGMSNAEIARRLYLSESTVKQHLRSAYKLLGVSNRTEAAALLRQSSA